MIYDTTIESLRRFNEDVREVAAGFECGIVLTNFQDLREGDVLETYETRQVERELSSERVTVAAAGRDAGAAGNWRDRMSTGRMRRVDEAIRQVLGDAVAGELKDPRVGFVTVTDVRTSPDLRHARVYVSVLGDDGGPSQASEREDDARRPAQRARLPAGAARRRAAPEAHADARVRLRRHDRPRAARRGADRGDRQRDERRRRRSQDTRERVLARLREDERFVLAAHENPDGDALGSLVAMQGLLTRARQGLA